MLLHPISFPNFFPNACGIFLLLAAVSGDVVERDFQDPYEVPYFVLKPTNGNYTFNPELKYPPYLRCLSPTPVYRRDSKSLAKHYIRKKESNKWRTYWSPIWSRMYFEDDDISVTWEYDRDYRHPSTPTYITYLIPIIVTMIWITFLVTICLIIYPVIGFILFRAFRLLWKLVSHNNIKRVIRWIVVKNARLRRNGVLRVYEDAGKHPPFSRYHLPRALRLNEKDVVPKEMDETDEEFWSSEDDDGGMKGNEKSAKGKVAPDFTPEYSTTQEVIPPISDEVFEYFVNMKKHGMFAVWTNGYSDLNLAEISREHASLYQQ